MDGWMLSGRIDGENDGWVTDGKDGWVTSRFRYLIDGWAGMDGRFVAIGAVIDDLMEDGWAEDGWTEGKVTDG